MEHRVIELEKKADKTDKVLADISKVLTELVRFQVATDTNTKHIDTLFDMVSENEKASLRRHEDNAKSIRTIENQIHQTCDIKTKEMSTMEADLEHKIDNSEEKTERHSTKLFLWSMAVIVTIASATFTTIMVLKSDDTDRDKVVTEKLDMLISLAKDTDKKVSLNSLEINHIKAEIDSEKEHRHNGDR